MKTRLKLLYILLLCALGAKAQINTDQVIQIGQNALYFEDYMLSIQYFNKVIQAKPYLARPYFLRAIAKLNLEDFNGAEEDATLAIERNPFITDAYEVRGAARLQLGKPDEAVADYDHALSMLPGNRIMMFNKALAQEDMKDFDAASETFAALLKQHPGFSNGYLGRARLSLELGDTVSAVADLDKAIQLDPNMTNAYVMRADIAIRNEDNYSQALNDMNEAIKLEPHYSGFFVNRAFLRYKLDDYFGAMADYDYAISLDPNDPTAYFNRGLLRAEVNDRDRAIADFSRVLKMNPDDYRALFNRAMLYRETKNYKKALADLDRVVEQFPDFDGLLFTRFQIYDEMGDKTRARRDYDKALALSKKHDAERRAGADKKETDLADNNSAKQQPANTDNGSEHSKETPEDLVSRRFSSLLTIENDHEIDREYNNKSIRGRVQNRNVSVALRPIFSVSYYATTNQLKETPYYIKEVDDINSTRALRFILMVTDSPLPLSDDDMINQHFNSIEYYNSYIATHTPRAIDFFGRGMDFLTIRNYSDAIADFTKAAEMAPDFTMAYFMRAIARYNSLLAKRDTPEATQPGAPAEDYSAANARTRIQIQEIIADFDKVIELSPRMPFAYYNKGVVLAEAGDNTSALSAFNQAIDLKHDLGEAYFNRGYIFMQLGQREKGAESLSKAGELGILPSYNLLKRMNR